MRQRGSSTVPAVILAALAGLATAVVLADWVIVDVQTPEPENVHLLLPLPLVVADVAAAVIPDDALEDVEIPEELVAQRELILGVLESLAEAPDATLVKVTDGSTRVEIATRDGQLHLAVDDTDATVRCTIPVAALAQALERWDWKSADPSMLLDVLHATPSGDLLTVQADDARVAIRMW